MLIHYIIMSKTKIALEIAVHHFTHVHKHQHRDRSNKGSNNSCSVNDPSIGV